VSGDGPFGRLGDETGQTLVELSISTVILAIVLSVFLAILVWVQTALVRENTRSSTVDQTRLAMEAIDREVRSGTVLYDPAVEEPAAYYGLRFATQALPGHMGETYCVQYRVSGGSLLRKAWASGAATASERTVATNIVNQGSAATSRPFQLDTSTAAGYGSSLGSRVVNLTFLVNAKQGDVASNTVRLQSSIAIRNQTSGDPCTPVPSG
jgi:hypothetical protein